MSRFRHVCSEADIGHFQCIWPEFHVQYLAHYDWDDERELRWNDGESLQCQLDLLARVDFSKITTWLARAFDTLMICCFINSSTQIKRNRLRQWHVHGI